MRLLFFLLAMLAASAARGGEPCSRIEHRGDPYTVCRFDPATTDIRLYHSDRSGKPYGSFLALENDLKEQGLSLRFAMNAGMYEEDLSPVGLYVENGEQRRPLRTRAGWGNFHLLPNGVLFIRPGQVGVMETKAFAAAGIKPDFATQSGPMLVIDGKLHPAFLRDSTSLKTRNGVGVSATGEVVFAISETPVRFYDFATLFRDVLDCGNALFLDGSISSLDLPEWQRRDSAYPIGPIVAVTERPASQGAN
jgi:uncharacterized protein YigE (DUF2233 family)